MFKQTDKPRTGMFYAIGAGILVGVLLNLGVLYIAKHHFNAFRLERSHANHSKETTSPALMDAILAIVRSYYVDANRTDNLTMLRQLMRNLDLHPAIDVQEESAFQFQLQIASHSKKIQLLGVPSDEQLIEILTDLGDFINESKINLVPDSFAQSASGIVSGRAVVMNTLLSALDAHSAFLSEDAYQELRQGTDGSFGGLGVLVGIRNLLLTVVRPMPNSPALRAGIQESDKILSIDGRSTFGRSLDELVEYMRGDPGSAVRLRILRDGAEAPEAYSLNREIIRVSSVESRLLALGQLKTLYAKIESFSGSTASDLERAIKKSLRANGGSIDGFVLDLRENPGGLLDQAVAVADLFLKEGVIVSTVGRKNEIETANPNEILANVPMAILINSESASASEIVAGALQDHRRAVVIGTPSFGKGSVQTIFELPLGQALKLTIARYLTPHARSIQNVGIVPDIWLQPVFKKVQKENLLGRFHYKGERFLRHHLSGLSEEEYENEELHHSDYQGFYLRDADSTADLAKQKDYDLETAQMVLARVKRVYPNGLKPGAMRSTHWLGLASQDIYRHLNRLNTSTQAWLHENHRIDWSVKPTDTEGFQNVILSMDEPQQAQVRAGESIQLNWTLENRGGMDASRLSVYAISESYEIENDEILVGRLGANGTVRGSIKLRVPWNFKGLHTTFALGLAHASSPTKIQTPPFVIRVIKKEAIDVATDFELISETGGKVAGVLEPGEEVALLVRVKNRSNAPGGKVDVRFLNLSGNQVALKESGPNQQVLSPKGEVLHTVKILGSNRLRDSDLEFGLCIDGEDIGKSVYETFRLPAKAVISQKSEPALAH